MTPAQCSSKRGAAICHISWRPASNARHKVSGVVARGNPLAQSHSIKQQGRCAIGIRSRSPNAVTSETLMEDDGVPFMW
eukprot:1161275-Pelagomonas_calceolata.AAC.13